MVTARRKVPAEVPALPAKGKAVRKTRTPDDNRRPGGTDAFRDMLKTSVNDVLKAAAKETKKAQPRTVNAVFSDADCAAFFLDEDARMAEVKYWVDTGIAPLNWLISSGRGLPVGRSLELWGAKGTFKSALAQFLSCRMQSAFAGSIVLYGTAEGDLNGDHLDGYGVDRSRFLAVRLPYMEAAQDIYQASLEVVQRFHSEAYQKKNPYGVVPLCAVWDSMAQTPPLAEKLERHSSSSHVGLQARLMSKFARKITEPMSHIPMTMILINQLRSSIGVMYGDPSVRPCGQAMDFACSTIIRTKIKKTLKKTVEGRDVKWGYILELDGSKARLAPPHRRIEIIGSFRKGPDVLRTAYHNLEGLDLLEPAGKKGETIPGIVDTPFTSKEWRDVFAENEPAINAAIVNRLNEIEAKAYEDDGEPDELREEDPVDRSEEEDDE